jgi:hypothetical protein
MRIACLFAFIVLAASARADTLEGRWKLTAAEDVRADGSVVRLPWGEHPVGAIVAQGGSCYVQIMSTDVPAFPAGKPVDDQMAATLLSSYIAYSGPCTFDDKAGTLALKVHAAWRPDYVGTDQKRMFHFENGKLIFGTLTNSIKLNGESLTRRLTLTRVQ